MACWWRAAALQALSAYVMGIMGKGMAEDAAQQVSGSNYTLQGIPCKMFAQFGGGGQLDWVGSCPVDLLLLQPFSAWWCS